MNDSPPKTARGAPPHGARPKTPPPVVPVRVAAMKARYKQSWLYFLFAISMLIAWGIPIRYAVTRYLMFRRVQTGPRVAEAFVALAYEGISEHPRDVAPEQFRAQLAALRAAGYNPLTLKDVQAFYAEGKLLPRKSVLLTFDHSRRSTYFDVRSPLARAGWPAAFFLWTAPILQEDPASLRWPYIRSMLRSGAWEVGSQGHRAFDRIAVDAEGTQKNYLVAPQWRANAMRHESPEAFRERIEADHRFARELIQRETGVTPRAFAFPYGDFGQYDARATLSRRLNMEMISSFYDLGFTHGAVALNTRFSDPRRLNRLLVKRAWTAAELIARLDNAWPREKGLPQSEALQSRLVWLDEWGGFDMGDDRVRLFAQDSATGARTWVNGSDLFDDYTARIRLRIERGQAGFFFRATPDGERYLNLVLSAAGEVWLRQKYTGLQPFTLGASRYAADARGEIDIEVSLRGQHFSVVIGGTPVFREVVTIRGEPQPGMLGVSIWDPAPGVAGMSIHGLEVEPFHARLLTWSPDDFQAPALSAWMNRHAVRYSHLAPPWLRVASRARTEQAGWDTELFRGFARLYAMQWTPEILLEGVEVFDTALPDHLAGLAKAMGADGVFLNMGALRGTPALSRVNDWLQSLGNALDQRGLSLVAQLPPTLESEAALASLFQSLPTFAIAVSGAASGFFRENPEHARRLVGVSAVAYQTESAPLYQRLTGGDARFTGWKTEVRGGRLRQEALEAFRSGRFDAALDIYGRWSEIEPHNAVPLMRMGDIHLRKGNRTAAIAMYRAGIERNPGGFPQVIALARLLHEEPEHRAAAVELLERYARWFPDNIELQLALAELLVAQRRHDEALPRVQGVIDKHPDDLAARALLHGLLADPVARLRNMGAMREIGVRSNLSSHFAAQIMAHQLHTYPESWMLMEHVEAEAAREMASGHPGDYARLAPRRTVVNEAFSADRMSPNWIAESGLERFEDGAFVLGATPIATEAVLRLANSDTMHSGFIEATVEDSRGHFWLYARRGGTGMIRFGFEQEGRLFLQVWHHGRRVANVSRTWRRPLDPFRIGLELRGDAAFGLIDGKPAFGAPVQVPPNMGLGWWGVSPWSAEFGVAQVALREVAGGPLPVNIALLWPRPQEWTDTEAVDVLRDFPQHLQAISPAWFVMESSGNVRLDTREPFVDFRTLSRFNQVRLLPSVRSASTAVLDVDALISLAREHRVDGFVLLLTNLPDDDWFRETEFALADTDLSLLALRVNRRDGRVEVREMGPRFGLFAGSRKARQIPLVDLRETQPDALPVPEPPETGESEIERPPQPDRFWLY